MQRGTKHTEESRRRISEMKIGIKTSDGNTGMKHSAESKQKMSDKTKAYWANKRKDKQ